MSKPDSPTSAKAETTGRDLGSFYRFSLDLRYRDQPVHIEFVGGCHVRRAFSVASGGSTVETLAMSAFVFGARMPEGHAVVVRSNPADGGFDVCNGATTSSGVVPADWLPLITWYERDDDFSFGIGYATQDAYRSPRARFEFVGATVERATAQDYARFVQDGPANLIPDHLSDSVSHLGAPYLPGAARDIPEEIRREPRKAWANISWPECRYVRMTKLDEAQQRKVAPFWPADRPRYWQTSSEPSRILANLLYPDQQRRPPERNISADSYEPKARPGDVYPISIDEGLAEIGANTAASGWYDHVLHIDDPSLKGFMYCDVPSTLELLSAVRGGPAPRIWPNIKCKVEEIALPIDGLVCNFEGSRIYLEDKYSIEFKFLID